MGSYTTNYQLYLPNVGEQGWGDLVNANFTKLDTILKSGEGIRSAQADKLTTARTINGTAFDGTSNVVTANWGTARTINGSSINGSANVTTVNWGTARSFSITDGTNTGTTTSVNGSGNVSLRLPTALKTSSLQFNGIEPIFPSTNSSYQIHTPNISYADGNTNTYIGHIDHQGLITGTISGNRDSGTETLETANLRLTYYKNNEYITFVNASKVGTGSSFKFDIAVSIPSNVDIYFSVGNTSNRYSITAAFLNIAMTEIKWYFS